MSDNNFSLLIVTLLAVLGVMAFWRLILTALVAAGLTVFGIGLIQVVTWISAAR